MKSARTILIALAVLAGTAFASNAQDGRPIWRVGSEWGYSVAFHNHYHYCYPDPEIGYRVDDEQYVNVDYLNAYWLVTGGLDITRHLGGTLGIGAMGIYKGRIAVPMVADLTWYFRDSMSDGPLCTVGGGIALNDSHRKPITIARAGFGYRFALSDWADLDFFLRFRSVMDHPRVWDSEGGRYIEESVVLKDNALYFAVSLGMALTF